MGHSVHYSFLFLTFCSQKPDIAALEAQIAHSKRKRDNAAGIRAQVAADVTRHEARLNSLKRDLEETTAQAEEAQGMPTSFTSCRHISDDSL